MCMYYHNFILFLERNLNPKVACLKRREDEKNIEMPKGHIPSGLPDLLDYPQIMSHPAQQPVSFFFFFFFNVENCISLHKTVNIKWHYCYFVVLISVKPLLFFRK